MNHGKKIVFENNKLVVPNYPIIPFILKKNDEMKKNMWDYYQKYTSSYQWIFPSGTWCQLGTYFNEFDYYAPKL